MRLLDRMTDRYRAQGYYEGLASGAAVLLTYGGDDKREGALQQMVAAAQQAYATNGVVFACELARIMLFAEARFQLQSLVDKRLYGTTDLHLLEHPWPDATTSDLLAWMELDVGAAGNSFTWQAEDDLLVRLPPDEVTIVSEVVQGSRGRYRRVIGYDWDPASTNPPGTPPGRGSQERAQYLTVDEVAHYAPYPDPQAHFRGMSWLTPVMRDVEADSGMTAYKAQFLDHAAPQPLDAKVLTPIGWSTMGALAVGDRVIGSDGKPHEVLGVYPQGERDIYRVTFSSGAEVECTDDHLWSVAGVYDRKLGVTRTMPLAEIMQGGVAYASGACKWSVPLVAPVEFDAPGQLPVEPYLLGSLLGDGYLGGNLKGSGAAELACHAEDVDEQIRLLTPTVPAGNRLMRDAGKGSSARIRFTGPQGTMRMRTCGVADCDRQPMALSLCSMHYQRPDVPRGEGSRANPLTERLKSLGLWGTLGYEKSIPEQYMRGSVSQRLALLQGLIDTDGSVDRRQPNTVRFDSTSETLCRQLADLAGGLGGIATARPGRQATATTRAQWHVSISRLPEWINPCRLSRKATLYRPTLRGGAYRYIRKIDYVGRKLAQCIAVDSADHLYVTDEYVLTHNTPNLVVSYPQKLRRDTVDSVVERMQARYGGVTNAFKTIVLDQGSTAQVVGSNFDQLDYSTVQGIGEDRICAAAGVDPILLGLLTIGRASVQYPDAMRRLAEMTCRHLWKSAAGSLQKFVPNIPDQGVRLWFDLSDVPALRQSETERAQASQVLAAALVTFVQAGADFDSAVAALTSHDISQLKAAATPAPVQSAPSGGQPGVPRSPSGFTQAQTPASKLPRPAAFANPPSVNGNGSRAEAMRFDPFHDPHSGKFTSGPGGSALASAAELILVRGQAQQKVTAAPVPSASAVAKAQDSDVTDYSGGSGG